MGSPISRIYCLRVSAHADPVSGYLVPREGFRINQLSQSTPGLMNKSGVASRPYSVPAAHCLGGDSILLRDRFAAELQFFRSWGDLGGS